MLRCSIEGFTTGAGNIGAILQAKCVQRKKVATMMLKCLLPSRKKLISSMELDP